MGVAWFKAIWRVLGQEFRPATTMATARALSIQAQRQPAQIGDALELIDTPALIVDLSAMESNMLQMAEFVRTHPTIRLRPHAKAHKTPEIALLLQRIAGGQGVCCQKVSEAEAMVMGGITDVYISNEVVDIVKLRRLISLNMDHRARVTICVDSIQGVNNLAQATQERNATGINVLIDCNVGQNRCGVDGLDDILALAELIKTYPSLRFAGIQTYQGSAQHYRTVDERREAAESVAKRALEIRDALASRGFPCEVITGAGSGTYKYEVEAGALNEIQCGSFIFNDGDYSQNLREDGSRGNEWQQSLFILTTVISVNVAAKRVVLDGGLKSFAVDSGIPQAFGYPDVIVSSGGDEHAILSFENSSLRMPEVGSRVYLIPSHCDPTVNLYDWIVGLRQNVVESVWQVTARGPGQ